MRISYWSSDGCSSDLRRAPAPQGSRVIREAMKMGDPRLLRIAQPVQDFAAPELQALITDLFDTMRHQIGRASWRERVCQHVSLSVDTVPVKTKNQHNPEPSRLEILARNKEENT